MLKSRLFESAPARLLKNTLPLVWGLEFHPVLRELPLPERVFYLLHFGYEVRRVDEFLGRAAAGEDQEFLLRKILDRREHLLRPNEL